MVINTLLRLLLVISVIGCICLQVVWEIPDTQNSARCDDCTRQKSLKEFEEHEIFPRSVLLRGCDNLVFQADWGVMLFSPVILIWRMWESLPLPA